MSFSLQRPETVIVRIHPRFRLFSLTGAGRRLSLLHVPSARLPMTTLPSFDAGKSDAGRSPWWAFSTEPATKIRYAVFRSKAPVIRGTIVPAAGSHESIEKYFETIGDLVAAGFWVATSTGADRAVPSGCRRTGPHGHVEDFTGLRARPDYFPRRDRLPDTRCPSRSSPIPWERSSPCRSLPCSQAGSTGWCCLPPSSAWRSGDRRTGVGANRDGHALDRPREAAAERPTKATVPLSRAMC